jgi:hypothetical protein
VRAWSANGRYMLAMAYGRTGDLVSRYLRLDLSTMERIQYVAPATVTVLGIREAGDLLLAEQPVRDDPRDLDNPVVRTVDPVTGRDLRRDQLDLGGGAPGSAPGSVPSRVPGSIGPLRAFAVNPDQRHATALTRCLRCTGSTDLVVLLLDLPTGRVLHRTDLTRDFVAARLVGAGTLIQAGGGNLLPLDPATGRRRIAARVPGHAYVVPYGANVN